jgi:hypothetical protein
MTPVVEPPSCDRATHGRAPRARPGSEGLLQGRVAITAAALLWVLACARMGPPPGGPDDKVPPKLIGTVPESLGVFPNWHNDVEFRFDEIISEGGSSNQGTGTGDLEKLILLSPSRGVPVVRWKRDRITVHPREGWRPNRVYRVQLLPGIQDLRRNRADTSTVIAFSTGGPPPTDTLSGLVIDWVQGKMAQRALVELVLAPDSLIYRTLTDSGGRFVIGPLPRGQWMVFGAVDQNRNLQRERRENYDSVALAPGALRVPPLWLIPRDTVGPRIQTITLNDSVSATVSFSQPLDPAQRFDSLRVHLVLQQDSTPVPFRSLLPKPADDSLQKQAQARADSLRLAADTTRLDSLKAKPAPPAPPPPRPRPGAVQPKVDSEADSILKTRPTLFDKMVLRVDTAFVPEARYQLEVLGIRSAAGVAGDAKSGFVIPKPKPPPAPADTTAQRADSTKPAAPPTTPAPVPKPRR